jgi:hypothetical protein
MKTMALVALLLSASAALAQDQTALRRAGNDMFGALTGDVERFECGMRTIEGIMSENPNDPVVKVLFGTGLFARAGVAFGRGEMEKAMPLWQSALNEMGQAVELAPENILVRARRGVVLISASRETPPAMAKPLIETAVGDFEKVLQIREAKNTLAQGSEHQRGELLTSLADGWSRLGDPDKARGYFERITRELKGTVYEERARAWLEGKPEATAPDFFACSGCHKE